MESQHWTIVAYDDEYLSRDEAHHLSSKAQEIGRLLGDMMQNPDAFCGEDYILRGTDAVYFAQESDDPLNTEY